MNLSFYKLGTVYNTHTSAHRCLKINLFFKLLSIKIIGESQASLFTSRIMKNYFKQKLYRLC